MRTCKSCLITKEMDAFKAWLIRNNFDPNDLKLSLGYLEIAHIDLDRSFKTTNTETIWEIMSNKLDIYSIECLGSTAVFDYSWADNDHEQRQINFLKLGYNNV